MARDEAVASFLAAFDKRLRGAAVRHLERVHRSAGDEPHGSGIAGIARKGGARCVRRIAQRRRELHALVHDHAVGEVILEGRVAQSVRLLRFKGRPVTDLERRPRSGFCVHLRFVPGKRRLVGIERDEPVHRGERDRPQRHRLAVAERKRRAHAVRPLEQRHKADVGHARCVRLVARKVERQRAAIEGPFDSADYAVRFAGSRQGGTRASHLVARKRQHKLLRLSPVGERIARAQGDLAAHDRRVPQRRETARLHAYLLAPRGDVERGRLQNDGCVLAIFYRDRRFRVLRAFLKPHAKEGGKRRRREVDTALAHRNHRVGARLELRRLRFHEERCAIGVVPQKGRVAARHACALGVEHHHRARARERAFHLHRRRAPLSELHVEGARFGLRRNRGAPELERIGSNDGKRQRLVRIRKRLGQNDAPALPHIIGVFALFERHAVLRKC